MKQENGKSENMELSSYVGMFVRVGSEFGMIDAVHGARLGFVHSTDDSWTAEIVRPHLVTVISDGNELELAWASALQYFEREHMSLRARIARHLPIDSEETLVEQLAYVESWLSRMAQNASK